MIVAQRFIAGVPVAGSHVPVETAKTPLPGVRFSSGVPMARASSPRPHPATGVRAIVEGSSGTCLKWASNRPPSGSPLRGATNPEVRHPNFQGTKAYRRTGPENHNPQYNPARRNHGRQSRGLELRLKLFPTNSVLRFRTRRVPCPGHRRRQENCYVAAIGR